MKLEQSEIVENSMPSCTVDLTPKDEQSVSDNVNPITLTDNQSMADDDNPKDEVEDYKKQQIFGAHTLSMFCKQPVISNDFAKGLDFLKS